MKMSIGLSDVLLFPILGAGRLRRGETPDVTAYMHHRLVSLLTVMGFINLVNSAAVVFTLYAVSEPVLLLAWLVPIWVFAISQIMWSSSHKGENSQRTVRGRFLKRAEWATGILGAWWGLCIMLAPASDLGLKVSMFAVVFGMQAGVVAVVSPVANVSARFLLGAASVALFGFLIAPVGLPATIVILGFVLLVASSFAGLNGYRNLLLEMEAKRLAAQNHEQLLDAVTAIPEAFAIYDAQGNVIIQNAVHQRWFPRGLEKTDFRPGTDMRNVPGVGGVMRSCVPTSSGTRVVIHTDVSNMEELRQEADEARRDAEEARLAVERFVGSVTRELRLPLRTLRAMASRFEPRSNIPFDEAEVRFVAEKMVSCSEQALSLVDEVLSITEGGENVVESADVSLKETLAQVISQKSGTITSFGVDIDAPSGHDTMIDGAKAARVVSRVFSAVLLELGQACRGGGTLRVRCGVRGQQGWVSVEAAKFGGTAASAGDDFLSETSEDRLVWRALMQTIGGQIEMREARNGSLVYILKFSTSATSTRLGAGPVSKAASGRAA
ncbi:hypothetical protein [Hyphomonas sp.]|uniref:hypothetical protein n=1 Tax=Hyphomonas sp. TaxID=87 RepID=UPI00391C01B1